MPDTHHAFEHVKGIYFPIAITAFAIMVGTLLVLLLLGARRRRAGERSEAMALELTYAFGLAAIVAFLVITTFKAETPIDRPVAHPVLRIRVVAAQWSWRFEYPGGAVVTATSTWRPPVAAVPTGGEVEFDGISKDVIHGFWVPDLRFMRQLLPGHVTRFDLIFHRPGRHEGVCSVFCGDQHQMMHFELQAMAPARFSAWMAAQARASAGADAGTGASAGASAGGRP